MVVALATLVTVTAGCRDSMREPDAAGAPSTTAAVNDGGVTLTGVVTRSLGAYVIQVGTTPPEPVLVVLTSPNPFPVGTRLEVTGRIRTFERAELEAELGVAFGPEVHGLEGQRCLVAATVRSL